MRFVRASRVFAINARGAERGLQERSNLLVAAAFAAAAIQSTVSVRGSCKEMLLSGNVNQTKGAQEGPTKIAKRYDMIWWFPFRPIVNFMFAMVGRQRGRSTHTRIVTLHVCIVLIYRSVEKLDKIVCWIWIASILLHHKLDVWAADSRVFVLFLFVWQGLTYREPALSWNRAQLRKMGKNSRGIVEFGHLLNQ